ncbi:MAG: cyclase family protein [Myxococcaceae bacterium]|nr:cyclase family protein [Myxococcaceae bacterium]
MPQRRGRWPLPARRARQTGRAGANGAPARTRARSQPVRVANARSDLHTWSVRWIDISVPVRDGMIHWPGDPPVCVEQTASLEKGDPAELRRLTLGSHSGTHVDAPTHFVEGGESLDQMPLDATCGPARVVRIDSPKAVTPDDLAAVGLEPGERLLLRTRNSEVRWYERPFREDFVHLTVAAALWLAERRPRAVGVDYLSVGGFAGDADGPKVHRALLSAGVWIIEGLYLGHVEPGRYELVCLPLRVERGDGAPARAAVRTLQA